MATRVKVMAILAPKAGHEAELETLLRSMAEASRKEPGNLHYDLWRSADQPGHFVIATKIDPGQDRSANASLSFRHDAENPLSPLGP